MTSDSASSLIQGSIATNVTFMVISTILVVSLLWQYLLPWMLADKFIRKNGRDPRPRAFFKLILITAITLFLASGLNVLFLAQDIPSPSATRPSDEGSGLRIENLSLNGWIAFMVIATIIRQLPYALVFLTLLNILQSRWRAFTKATKAERAMKYEDEATLTDAKLPAFLGWRGKEHTSLFVAILLIALPILSTTILAIGLGTTPNPMAVDAAPSEAFTRFERLEAAATWLDALRAGAVFISVVDVAASSYALSKRQRAAGYKDSITTSVLRIFTPFLTVFALQVVVTSAIQTLGPSPSEYTLAAAGLSTVVVGDVITTILLLVFSVLYAALPRWVLASPAVNVHELPTLSMHAV